MVKKKILKKYSLRHLNKNKKLLFNLFFLLSKFFKINKYILRKLYIIKIFYFEFIYKYFLKNSYLYFFNKKLRLQDLYAFNNNKTISFININYKKEISSNKFRNSNNCFIKITFKLRNLFLNFYTKYKIFFFSVGKIKKNSNERSIINYQLYLIKIFFFTLISKFKSIINLKFNRPSKKIIKILSLFNFYTIFFNEERFKKKFLIIKSIIINHSFNIRYLIYKKKPRKKKIFRKKFYKYIY